MSEEKEVVSAKVMGEVMDRFVNLVEQNNKSYSAMALSIESLAGNQVTLTEKVDNLERTIDEEQLGVVMNQANAEVKASVAGISQIIQNCAVSNMAFAAEVSKHLIYLSKDPKVFAESVLTLLSVVSFVKRRLLLLVFLAGVVMAPLVVNSGIGVISFLSKFLIR